jgi:hypothetical protein
MLICCMFTASAMVVPLLLLKNTADDFLYAEFRIVEFFPRCSINCVNAIRFPVLVSSEKARKQNMEEQENILDMVQRSPTTSTRRLSTRVWRTSYEDGLYTFHQQPVQNLLIKFRMATCLCSCGWRESLGIMVSVVVAFMKIFVVSVLFSFLIVMSKKLLLLSISCSILT